MKKSKLKRRLRKKLHVGEFQVFGFEVSVKFKSNLSETDSDKLYDEFIGEIEANKLLFGGGGGFESMQGFVTGSKNYQSPTIAQREKIKNWLENHREIAQCKVGNFKDAWYDDK
jgi:uncharacterized protein